MTKAQELAIEQMEKSLKQLKKVGISIAGMDSGLYWATKKAMKKNNEDFGYCEVANACKYSNDDTGEFANAPYQDSGGW